MNPAIVDGIISVANQTLRLEGVEAYKKYLSKRYWSEEQIKEVINTSLKEGFDEEFLGIDLESHNEEQLLASMIMYKLGIKK